MSVEQRSLSPSGVFSRDEAVDPHSRLTGRMGAATAIQSDIQVRLTCDKLRYTSNVFFLNRFIDGWVGSCSLNQRVSTRDTEAGSVFKGKGKRCVYATALGHVGIFEMN